MSSAGVIAADHGGPHEDNAPATRGFVRVQVNDLRVEMVDRFAEVNGRVDRLSSDMFDRFAEVNGRVDRLSSDMSDRFAGVNGRVDGLRSEVDERIGKQNRWLALGFVSLASLIVAGAGVILTVLGA